MIVRVPPAKHECAHAACPSGCTEFIRGSFSSRIMWRAQGTLMSYMYYPGKEERCGADWLWDKEASDEEWQFQKTYVRMNTIGARLLACVQPELVCDAEVSARSVFGREQEV